jgi:hypothetical protein
MESPSYLRPLEPDLLGEYFVLEHVKPAVDPLGSRAQVLCTEAWRLNRISFASFIHKATANFRDHPGVEVLDRRWADGPKDWFVWAGNLFFRMGDFAEQGKFDRILRDYRQILEIARQPVEPNAEIWLSFIVHDLVKLLGEADRRADADQVYEEYLRFLQDARLEQEYECVLAEAERDLVTLGCRANDLSPYQRLWPRLLERAKASSQLEVVALAAWAVHDSVLAFSDREKNSTLTAFRSIAALLEGRRGTAPEETELWNEGKDFWEVPVRCAGHLIASCWKDEDVDSCVMTFVDAVRHLPAIRPNGEPELGLNPLEAIPERIYSHADSLSPKSTGHSNSGDHAPPLCLLPHPARGRHRSRGR